VSLRRCWHTQGGGCLRRAPGRPALLSSYYRALSSPTTSRAASRVSVTSLSPGIFTAPQTGSGPAAALVQRINGANVTYEQTARYDPLAARFVALPISLTGSDQSFLLLFGTGVRGVTSRNIITATVGGVPVDVTYVGAQGQYEGLDQLNLRLLLSLAGKGLADVKINVDGQPFNTVQINLQ
jgi:uncharacterized protein (TIGR03437 family)